MVRKVLGIIAGGGTVEEVLESYPGIERENVAAALKYAAAIADRYGRAATKMP